MPISLHHAVVTPMLQTLGAAQTWLAKAQAAGLPEAEITSARLIDDMLPFAYQVKSMATHSHGAILGVRAGTFSPDMEIPATMAQLQDILAEAESFLQGVEEAELESLIGQDMRFQFKDYMVPFAAEDFLLTFSLPNFYFHATTTYALLRARGVAVGKRDYLGQMRVKA